MPSPEEIQQEDTTIEASIAAEFDRLENEENETDDTVQASTDSEEETAEEITEEVTATEEVEASEETTELQEEEQIEAVEEFNDPAPERWPEEYQTYYNGLDPQGKEIFLNKLFKPMQGSHTKAMQEVAGMRKQLDPMLETMNQYREQFDKAGVNPAEGFRQQMAWMAHINKVGPQQGLQDMANAYGVKEFGQQEVNSDDQYLTPIERSMKQQLDELSGKLQQQETGSQERQQARTEQIRQRQINELQHSIQDFATAKKDGQLLHPHMEQVAPSMTGLMNGGLVAKLDDYNQPVPYSQQLGQAYQMACNLDPSIKNLKATATRTEQVQRAKDINRGVVTKAPVRQKADKNRPIVDDIGDVYDDLAKRKRA